MPLRGPAIPSPTDCQLIDRPNPVALAPRRIILLQVYRFPRNRHWDSIRIAGVRVRRFSTILFLPTGADHPFAPSNRLGRAAGQKQLLTMSPSGLCRVTRQALQNLPVDGGS